MPHDLLFAFKIEVEDKFKPFLKPNDGVRGEHFSLTINVTNFGKDSFPGGTIKELEIRYNEASGGSRVKTVYLTEKLPKCSKIEPEKTKTLFSGSLIAKDEGLARVSMKLEAKDKKPIKYYQKGGFPLPEDSWLDYFHVVNREQLLIVMHLQQLLKSLSK